jgi:t-SNARE complex subunit (syntaxin)
VTEGESAREAADRMEQDADRMEERVEELGEHIEEAEQAAARRPEADSDILGDVAGDWEDEASGADQGEDAVDAARSDPEKRDADG